jgi:hypothetical protein
MNMDKKVLFAIATVILLGAAYAAYTFWQNSHPVPEIVQSKNTPTSPPVPPPAPVVSQVIEIPPPVLPPLPQLAKSDSFVLDALSNVLGNNSLKKLFHTDQIIRNIVVTVDNLPRQRVPAKSMPLNPPPGHFLAAGSEDNLIISPKNAIRYAGYVSLADAVDPKQLVGLYVRLYPLFQQAYGDLGYPNKNFNDQLNDTLDDLLDTPDIKEPIKLVQPKFFYQYADAETEALSIGEKIMLRLGSKNQKIVKNKLGEIKQELAQHATELK